MGLNINYSIRCDHCGVEVPIELRSMRTLPDAIAVANRDGGFWEQVDQDKCVCGRCAPELHAILDAHERNLAEF